MKKIIQLIIIMSFMVVTGCTKQQNITFEAQIESVSEQSMMVVTSDEVGFSKASVGLNVASIEGQLEAGGKVKITIHPEVRETYPVQVTATKVEVISTSYQKLTAAEAKKMIDERTYGVLLDVRTLEEYNEGHIQGAMLIPDDELRKQAEILPEDKATVILVYCRRGKRSRVAVKTLIDIGYTNVYDMGGLMTWPYEVVK